MLIIMIGHGNRTEPFTCSCFADKTLDAADFEAVRAFAFKEQDMINDWVDEILVVENDVVIEHYSWEDGLGADSSDGWSLC